jgi:hypothetical protein
VPTHSHWGPKADYPVLVQTNSKTDIWGAGLLKSNVMLGRRWPRRNGYNHRVFLLNITVVAHSVRSMIIDGPVLQMF